MFAIFTLAASMLVRLHEDRPLRIGAVGGGGAEHLAFEVLGLGDAVLLQRHDGKRGRVIDHHHGLDRQVARVVAVLHQRVDVGEADAVGARGDAVDALDRARARVDGDVQAFRLVVTLVDRDEERRGRPLEAPVQGKAERGLFLCRRCTGKEQGGEHSEETHADFSPVGFPGQVYSTGRPFSRRSRTCAAAASMTLAGCVTRRRAGGLLRRHALVPLRPEAGRVARLRERLRARFLRILR